MKIKKITKLNDIYTRYDLSIKGTHNFVCSNVVVHNTSAHIKIERENVSYFSGGVSQNAFEDVVKGIVEKNLSSADLPIDIPIFIYGEAYGGSCQKMSRVYGPDLKFVVFDVKIGEIWLNVPNAEDVAKKLGLEFVHYELIDAEIEEINAQRDSPSVQSERNGVGNKDWKEGIVLRPLQELIKSNGKRVISKHKREEYRETKTPRDISPEQLKILSNAQDVADEWVTEMRLIHVLDKLTKEPPTPELIPKLIPAMIEDIRREGEGEIEWSKEAGQAIAKNTVCLFKTYINKILNEVT